MNIRYIGVLLAGLLLSAGLAQAEIYKYYDKNGNLVLTDTPPDGAERVETKPMMTIPALAPDSRTIDKPSTPAKAASTSYSIVIQMPEKDATYQRNSGESIPFAYSVNPSLQDGHVLEVLLDGQPTEGMSVSADTLERGTHTLSVKVRDANKKELAQASSVFYIQQQTINKPGAGNKPLPAPKPKK